MQDLSLEQQLNSILTWIKEKYVSWVYLRLLLHKYEKSLTFYDSSKEENVLNCDKWIVKSVQKYKHIVTKYIGSKYELWNVFVIVPVFGFVDDISSHEFAKSHGVLHYHALDSIENDVDNDVS